MKRSTFALILGATLAAGLGLPGQGFAQTTIPLPFQVVGFIQKATIDTPGNAFSGGKITINGQAITVPSNTLLEMPGRTITWGEVFLLAPAAYRGLNQSGLALTDTPAPLTTYEATVAGNQTVTGEFIAGLVFLSQQSANIGQGNISYIDYAHGEVHVGGVPGDPTTGARVQLNDPTGQYGIAHSPDPRLSIDAGNPTVRATTGFPMCIARTGPPVIDPLCPETNRPKNSTTGQYLAIYTMPPPGGVVTPDATRQTPLEIGDFITYSGGVFSDTTGQYVSAWSVVANLGIFTSPGAMPAYVAIDTLTIGTGVNTDPLAPQEPVDKLVAIGYTTDPTQLVDVFAMDVNPCTGITTDRYYVTQTAAGPPLSGLKGRWTARLNVGNFLPPTREMRAVSRTLSNGAIPINTVGLATYANGVLAGQYHSPNFKFDFPDAAVIGGVPVPLNFQDFPFLVDGSGPYTAVNGQSTARLGPLSPWPGNSPQPPAVCSNFPTTLPPIPNAGANQTVASSTASVPVIVTLNGSGSLDPNNPPLPLLQFDWVQAGGPQVTLSDPTIAKPTFVAPVVPAGSAAVQILFEMAVSNGISWSGIVSTAVTVQPQAGAPAPPPPPPPPPTADKVTIASAVFTRSQSKLTVTASSSDTSGKQQFTLQVTGRPSVTMTNLGRGNYSASVIEPSAPTQVTVVSTGGGSAAATVK
jgi:hypothetical protein